MKLFTVGAVSALLSLSNGYQDVRKNFGDHRVVEFPSRHLMESEVIKSIVDAHDGDNLVQKEGKVSIKLPENGVKALLAEGLELEDTTEQWISQLQANFDNPNLFCKDGAKACAGRNTEDFYLQYQDLDAVLARVDRLVEESGGLATTKIMGQSFENRDIPVIEIGDQTKPLAYGLCTIHAREWLSPMYCTYMIEKLLENGGHRLLDDFSFAIVPVGNPDGYEHSRKVFNLWRKTRNTNEGSECIGTDPNRNYGNNHCGAGTSNDPCSNIFCGPFPFSTPEVNALNEYAKTVEDRLITWIDYHSFGSFWLSPLGFTTGEPPAVDYRRMLKCMRAAEFGAESETGEDFTVGPAADLLGVAAGASDDFFYFEYDVIYSYTVEMRGSSFQPPPENIDPSNREIFAATVEQLDCIRHIENL